MHRQTHTHKQIFLQATWFNIYAWYFRNIFGISELVKFGSIYGAFTTLGFSAKENKNVPQV